MIRTRTKDNNNRIPAQKTILKYQVIFSFLFRFFESDQFSKFYINFPRKLGIVFSLVFVLLIDFCCSPRFDIENRYCNIFDKMHFNFVSEFFSMKKIKIVNSIVPTRKVKLWLQIRSHCRLKNECQFK